MSAGTFTARRDAKGQEETSVRLVFRPFLPHQTDTKQTMMSRRRHLFQHVLQPLRLEVDDELLLLPPVQILQQASVTGVVEVFHADGADLPVVLSRLLHDGLQDGVPWKQNAGDSLTENLRNGVFTRDEGLIQTMCHRLLMTLVQNI